MQEVIVTLVFMMALLMFAAFPAYKAAHFLQEKYALSPKMENLLTLVLTILLALTAAIFLKIG